MNINAKTNLDYTTKSYPYLGINLNTKHVVLFTKSCCGVTLDRGSNPYTTNGEYYEAWVEDNFITYNGEITLKNT